MSKLPYGGFDRDPESEDDDSWTKLDTIVEYLEAGEVVPSYLAWWLADAIERSGHNPDELLRRLELKKRRGRQRTKFTRKQSIKFGYEVCQLEDDGMGREAALTTVLMTIDPQPERSQLQKWRDEYKSMLKEAHAVDLENAASK